MCFSNSTFPSAEDLRRELNRLRWEAEVREKELDRLYQQEDQLKRVLYRTNYAENS